MPKAPMPKLPKYVFRDVTHSGVVRYRLRLPGHPKIRLPGVPGSPEFENVYQHELKKKPRPIGIDRTIPGTINELIVRYYESDAWKGIAQSSRNHRRPMLERLRERHGDKPAKALDHEALSAMLAKLTPSMANAWLKTLRVLYRHGIEAKLVKHDPTEKIVPAKFKSTPHRRWMSADLEKFRRRHSLGTRARLAFELLVGTALRLNDMTRLGPQHLRTDPETGVQFIEFEPKKTEAKGTIVRVPFTEKVAEAIAAMPMVGVSTFLVSRFGKPYQPAGISFSMRQWCDEAGLKGLTAHGIRHAIGSTLAEKGAEIKEIMAVLGHSSPAMALHYSEQASKLRLTQNAFARLAKL